MRKIISSLVLKNILTLLVFAVIAKFIALVMLFFLPKNGVEIALDNSNSVFYKSYRLSRAFGLQVEKKENTPLKEVFQIDSLILHAIYGNSKQGFIVFAEKNAPNANKILALNHEYKGYKLISIKQKSVLLEKDLKSFELLIKQDGANNYIKRISKPIVRKKDEDTSTDVLRTVSKKDVMYYAKNFKAIWKNIAIKEIKKDGVIDGFKILSVKKNSIFSQLGLTKGDVIKSVNNQQIKSYGDAFKIYNNIQDYESLKIEIIRNKQKKELEYEIF